MPGLNYPGEPPVGGGGAEEIFNLTSAPDGGWTLIQQAKALHYNGYDYVAWVRANTTGPIYVASYRQSTEVVSTPVLIDGMSGVDDHNNPGMLVRDSDHKMLFAFGVHNGPNTFLRVSTTSLDTDPTLANGLAAAVNLDASIGASDYTYPALFQLTSIANDPIYLFYRDMSGSTGRLAYSKSTDGGSTWSARTVVMTGASGLVPYWSLASNGTNRIDVFTTDRDYGGSEGTVDLGHMYLDGATDKWYTSAGVEITAAKPFTHSELTQLETNVAGVFAVDSLSSTNPIVAYLYDNSSQMLGKYGRWNGSAWDKGTVYTEAYFPMLDTFYGSLAINRADPEEVFAGIKSGASSAELYKYESADLGLTWGAGTAVTTGSADLNAAPIGVINGDATLPVLWLRGTWTDSSNFSFSIKGLRR